MITLTTGVPGSGKSLYTISQVKELAEKEERPVYYHGIKDLMLPWIEMENATDWDECPVGAIIVIDECQSSFRPRGLGKDVPAYIAAMETHRHKGYDIFLITQHPMLVDQNIRRLVGRHWHVVRKFGLQLATIHEWGSQHEITQRNLLAAVRRQYKYSKEHFSFYKSAELHTHKAKIPKRVYFLVLAPLLIIALGWYGYTKAFSVGKKPDTVQLSQTPASTQTTIGNPDTQIAKAEYFAAAVPRLEGLHHTAPKYDELTKATEAPWPSACMITKGFNPMEGKVVDRCGCIDQQGNRYQTTDKICRDIALNGIFKDWGQPKNDIRQARENPSREAAAEDRRQAQRAEPPPPLTGEV